MQHHNTGCHSQRRPEIRGLRCANVEVKHFIWTTKEFHVKIVKYSVQHGRVRNMTAVTYRKPVRDSFANTAVGHLGAMPVAARTFLLLAGVLLQQGPCPRAYARALNDRQEGSKEQSKSKAKKEASLPSLLGNFLTLPFREWSSDMVR